MKPSIALSLLLVTLIAATHLMAADPDETLEEAIRAATARLESSGGRIAGRPYTGSVDIIPALYAGRKFRPLWESVERIDTALRIIANIDGDGLRS